MKILSKLKYVELRYDSNRYVLPNVAALRLNCINALIMAPRFQRTYTVKHPACRVSTPVFEQNLGRMWLTAFIPSESTRCQRDLARPFTRSGKFCYSRFSATRTKFIHVFTPIYLDCNAITFLNGHFEIHHSATKVLSQNLYGYNDSLVTILA